MTNYSDQWATNEAGEKFVFTVEMQRRLAAAGLPVEPASISELKAAHAPPPAPTREQREARREEKRNDRREYQAESFERTEEIEVDEATGKLIGRLIMFNPRKGFGFIARGLDDKIYFHEKKTLDDPRYMSEGQKVLYEVNEYRGKEEAIEVEEYEEFD